jgi:hypothetical protein
MRRKLDCGEILPWLIKTSDDFSREFFDGMPPVTFTCAKQKDCHDIEARYCHTTRVVEFSPGFIKSCWKGKRRFWDLGRLRVTLLHELIHAWVDWKGLWSEFGNGHNEWFLYKAWSLGLNVHAVRGRWPETGPLDDDIRLGWDPSIIKFSDWRALIRAAKGWEHKDWEDLVLSCRLIADSEAGMSAYDWRRVLAALKRCNPIVSDYKVVLEIERRVPLNDWWGLRRMAELGEIPYYKADKNFSCGHAHRWSEIVQRSYRVVQIIEHWGGASVYHVAEEFGHARPTLLENTEAIKCCKPLRELFARLWTGFNEEAASADRFANELVRNCADDEQLALYSEPNRLCFQKPDTDIYQFFRLVFAS